MQIIQLEQILEKAREYDTSVVHIECYHQYTYKLHRLVVQHSNGFSYSIGYTDMVDLQSKLLAYLDPWVQYK